MKEVKNLYKFRSFDNWDFVHDIILNERLYCARFSELNDPCEGVYEVPIGLQSENGPVILTESGRLLQIGSQFNTISDFVKSRICCLSSDCNDLRMWAYYGGNLKGFSIEISYDKSSPFQKVSYKERLPTANEVRQNEKEYLKRKLKIWEHEEEYRTITDQEFINISESITSILVGPKIVTKNLDLLKRLVNDKYPIVETEVDFSRNIVVPKKTLH